MNYETYTEIAISVFSMMALGHIHGEKAIKIACIQATGKYPESQIKDVETTLKAKLTEWRGLEADE